MLQKNYMSWNRKITRVTTKILSFDISIGRRKGSGRIKNNQTYKFSHMTRLHKNNQKKNE